jgi:hypothetical protein
MFGIWAMHMSPEEPDEKPDEEPEVTTTAEPPDKTVDWRRKTLRRAGYEGIQITILAERTDIDLHEACDLLEQGCPPDTAVLILS